MSRKKPPQYGESARWNMGRWQLPQQAPPGAGYVPVSSGNGLSDWQPIVTSSVPPGVMFEYGGEVAPDGGYLLCDGGEYLREEYAALFNAIGTRYGAGNGSTTFNVPDRRGRLGLGAGSGPGLTPRTLGDTLGEEEVTLTEAQMPDHTHAQDPHNHTQDPHNHTQDPHNHTQNPHNHSQDPHSHEQHDNGVRVRNCDSSVNAGGNYGDIRRAASPSAIVTSSITQTTATNNSQTATNQQATATNQQATATNQQATATNQNAGGGQAHNNMPPCLVVTHIIKT